MNFHVSKKIYALDVLEDLGLLGAHLDSFPMEQNLKLTLTDGLVLNDLTKYKSLVGRLIYLTVTKLDIVYFVHTLSEFMHEPKKPHWDAAPQVLLYIKGTPAQGFLFPSANNFVLKAYHKSDNLALKAYCDLD